MNVCVRLNNGKPDSKVRLEKIDEQRWILEFNDKMYVPTSTLATFVGPQSRTSQEMYDGGAAVNIEEMHWEDLAKAVVDELKIQADGSLWMTAKYDDAVTRVKHTMTMEFAPFSPFGLYI